MTTNDKQLSIPASQEVIEQEAIRVLYAIPDDELSGPGLEYFRNGLTAPALPAGLQIIDQ